MIRVTNYQEQAWRLPLGIPESEIMKKEEIS